MNLICPPQHIIFTIQPITWSSYSRHNFGFVLYTIGDKLTLCCFLINMYMYWNIQEGTRDRPANFVCKCNQTWKGNDYLPLSFHPSSSVLTSVVVWETAVGWRLAPPWSENTHHINRCINLKANSNSFLFIILELNAKQSDS